jgi:hypothetical protein
VRHVFLSICVLGFSTSTADADLRYRARIEVRTTSPELKTAMPVVETAMMISGDAIRVEQVRGGSRSVLLFRPDGRFVLDLEARTYFQIPAVQAAPMTSAPPTFRRTGDFETILGLRAERVDVTMSLVLPITPPPGMPTVMTMTGEFWIADAHRDYATNIRRTLASSDVVPPGIEGIVLRQVVRNAEFGIEIEHLVTELLEAPVAPEMFELPAGFRSLIDPAGRR